ncbi:MAG: GNAT family N-acetyltransferase [Rhodobacteraceae bacterium]|nr:GNAT family N-acetyltransferase [Paracoccaceae bacterium]
MALANGFYEVPKGKVAAVVTHFEMRAPAPLRPVEPPQGWALERVTVAKVDWYRSLYRRVGRDYLWWSRLMLADDALKAIIRHKDVEIFALRKDGVDGGIVELDHRDPAETELAFFGVDAALMGTTAARYMMNFAIETAWARPVKKLFIHTCTLDSPKAIGFYRRSGFVPLRQEIEIADDPRLNGVLPTDSAPQIPTFE